MRCILTLLGLLLLVAAASPARADELFVLDNGEVLRGWVISEDEDSIHVQLTSFKQEARIHIPRSRIVNRYVSLERGERYQDDSETGDEWVRSTLRLPSSHRAMVRDQANATRWLPELPAEEPGAEEEGFFHRLARRTVQSVPPDPARRALLAGLVFAALLALVALGGRVAEIDTMSLSRIAVLAALLGSFLVLDIYLHMEVLRADRAVWVLPLQFAIWCGAAMGLLRSGLGKTVLLFAFVLFCTAVCVFAGGVLLVSF